MSSVRSLQSLKQFRISIFFNFICIPYQRVTLLHKNIYCIMREPVYSSEDCMRCFVQRYASRTAEYA